MLATVGKLLPFAIGGAFLPTWTSWVVLLLGTERPLGNSFAYVAGNAVWRIALGFGAIFIASISIPTSEQQTLAIPTWAAWAIAAILLASGVWLVVFRPSGTRTPLERLSGWIGRLKRLPPWAAFGYGVYNCALPGSQWVYFLGGCAVIASSGLAWEWQIVLLAVFVASLETMLLAPILLYMRRQEAASAAFAHLDSWLARNAVSVLGGILLMLGGLFTYIAVAGGRIGG